MTMTFVMRQHREGRKLIVHATGVPLPPTGRADVEPVQLVGNAAQRPFLPPPPLHERRHLRRWPAGIAALILSNPK
jgi:hypothetical protein